MFLLRRPILAVSRSSRVRDLLVRAPVTRRVVQRFIAGTSTADAVATVRDLRAQGLQVTLDFLGEGVTDARGAQQTVDAYVRLIESLRAAEVMTGVEVSLNLTAFGLSLVDGETVALTNARRIADVAYAAGGRLTVDMEDSPTVDATLRVLQLLRADVPDIGVAIQAMLHRTPTDLEQLTGAGSRARLV